MPFDANKLYCSEILAILLQNNDSKCVSLNGLWIPNDISLSFIFLPTYFHSFIPFFCGFRLSHGLSQPYLIVPFPCSLFPPYIFFLSVTFSFLSLSFSFHHFMTSCYLLMFLVLICALAVFPANTKNPVEPHVNTELSGP